MSIGSKELAITELDTFEDERLAEELKKAKAELFNLRFQSATGQLESHGRIRAVKRDIARIYTVIRERELGIRATPAPVDTTKASKKKAKAELFNLRFQSATGQLESHGRVRQVKRDIARIYTVLRERELGIRPTPAAAPEKKGPAKKSTKKTEQADAAADTKEA